MQVHSWIPHSDVEVTNYIEETGKRANFVSIQMSHYVPTEKSNVSRVRTGYEQIVAHRTKMPFAYAAEQDGKIEAIDENTKMVKIRYKDGKLVSVNYGSEYTSNAANGFFVDQEIAVNGFKPGDKVKRGDIVCYNRQFFTPDPYSKQVDWNIGVLTNVALLDNGNTIEDSSFVCQPLCDKLGFSPIATKDITLTKDTNVHQIARIGSMVRSTEPLMVFDQSAIGDTSYGTADAELIQMLGDLNKATPKAEHSGEVVQIDVFYKCPFNELSKSLQTIVAAVSKLKNERAKFAADTATANKFQPNKPLVDSDRVGIVDLTDETVVFKFYIKQGKGLRVGDKVFYDSSLKSVVSRVVPESIEVEDKSITIDACTSARGILARIITSPFLVGIPTGILAKVEQDLIKIWEE